MNVLKKLLAISFFVCAANISKKIQTFAQIGIFFRNVFKSLKIGVGEIQKLKPVIKEYLVLSRYKGRGATGNRGGPAEHIPVLS